MDPFRKQRRRQIPSLLSKVPLIILLPVIEMLSRSGAHSHPSLPPHSQRGGSPWKYRTLQVALLLFWPILLLVGVYAIPRRTASPSQGFQIHRTSPQQVPRPRPSPKHVIPSLKRQDPVSAHDLDDWLTGAVHSPPARGASPAAPADEDEDDDADVVSHAIVHASASGTGLVNKYFYRFQNVEISGGKLTVYYDPATLTPPTKELWVDMISGNASTPDLPTMFVIKGDTNTVRW